MNELPPVFICLDDRGSLWRYRKELDYWVRERIVCAEWAINRTCDDTEAAKAFAEAVEVYVPVEKEDKS